MRTEGLRRSGLLRLKDYCCCGGVRVAPDDGVARPYLTMKKFRQRYEKVAARVEITQPQARSVRLSPS